MSEKNTQAEAPSEREAWPVMPPSKGQSPILFEDGYAEGWAKCLAACQEREAALATQQAGQGEVVATVVGSGWTRPTAPGGYNYAIDKALPVGTKLYTTPPAPQQPTQAEAASEQADAIMALVPRTLTPEEDALVGRMREALKTAKVGEFAKVAPELMQAIDDAALRAAALALLEIRKRERRFSWLHSPEALAQQERDREDARCTCATSGPDYCARHAP